MIRHYLGLTSVQAAGVLSFATAPDASGTAVVTVVARDDGGTAEGGQDVSQPVTFTVTVLRGNTPPWLDLDLAASGTGFAAQFVGDGGPVHITAGEGLGLMDAEDTHLQGATVRLTNALDGSEEVLAVDAEGRQIGAVYDESNGVLSLSGLATLEEYAAVLRTTTYENTSQVPGTMDRAIEFVVSDGEDESPAAVAVVSVSAGVVLELMPGWNLLSLPVDPGAGATTGDVLSDSVGEALHSGPVWSWDVQSQAWTRATEVEAVHGFWAYRARAGAGLTHVVSGAAGNGRIALRHGWNLVGPTADVVKRDVRGLRALLGPIWAWDSSSRTYQSVSDNGMLERGKGYWMLVPAAEGAVIDTLP